MKRSDWYVIASNICFAHVSVEFAWINGLAMSAIWVLITIRGE